MTWLEIIGIILLLALAFWGLGSKRKNHHTPHYPGDYTTNHTFPPSMNSTMPTMDDPRGNTSSLDDGFEK